MTTDSKPQTPYDAVIADLRAKRRLIDQTIAFLEHQKGGGLASSPPPTGGIGGAIPAQTGALIGTAPDITETDGMFLGMSIVDATRKLLMLRKRTMKNTDITQELQAGGLALTGKDPVNVVGSVLTRRFNQVGDIVKVGRGIWGLKEWYPGRNFKPLGKNITLISSSETNKPEKFLDDNDALTGLGEPQTDTGVVDLD